MKIQSRLTAVPAPWRAAAIALTVLVNIAVLWVAVDSTRSTPPVDPSRSGVTVSPPGTEDAAPEASAPEDSPAEPAPEEDLPVDELPVDVLVTVTPTPSGMLDVIEEVRPTAANRRLVLRPPPSLGANARPALVLGLAVVVDGTRATVAPASQGRWRIPLPEGASDVVLSYRLSGVTERRRAAPDGRVLLQLRPLTMASEATPTAVIEIAGASVHNLVCPDRPLADQLCARPDGDRWRTAPVPMDESTVVAQIDLPTTDLST